MIKQVRRSEIFAEFFGSIFLVMAAISSMIMFAEVFESGKEIAVLANAISVGFVLCVLIEMFAPVSGAHFNPVVTLVMLLDKKITAKKAAIFVLFQFLGGIIGAAFSHLMFFDTVESIFAVSDNVRDGYTYLGEIFGSFILVLAILMLVQAGSKKISLLIGFLVGGQLLATSSTMFANPQVTTARMLSPTASATRHEDAAIFIIMQIIGASLAYFTYRFFFQHKNKVGT